MKMVFVVHNEHYTERVMGLLACCNIDYYTRRVHATSKGHETEPPLGKGMIEAWGWQSVFLAAGVPVLLIPFVLRSLPDDVEPLPPTGATP